MRQSDDARCRLTRVRVEATVCQRLWGLRECEHFDGLPGCSGPGLGPEFDGEHLTGFDGGPRQTVAEEV